jgi:septal ring factor EnvC (AmiA/AmiB activator)
MELLIGGGVGAGVVGGFWAWLKGRPTGQAALIGAAAQLQTALNEAAESRVAELRAEVKEMAEEIAELKRENEQCRAEGEALRGELRQQKQTIDSLMRQLRDPASTLPGGSLEGAVIHLSEGGATVTKPADRRGRSKR